LRNKERNKRNTLESKERVEDWVLCNAVKGFRKLLRELTVELEARNEMEFHFF
jgi:hypothetical protein